MQSYRDDFFAWEQCKLGTLFEFKNGLNKGKEFFGSGVPIVNYMDVNKNTILTANVVKGRVDLNKDEIEKFSVHDNDLFFTRTSETSEEIGFTAAITHATQDTVFSGFILRARPILKLNSEFYAYYLRTMPKRNEIIRHSSITTRALTSGSLLKGMTVSWPAIDEQNEISYILRKIDHTITLHEEKKHQLERLKSALLQKMFADKSGYPAVRFEGFDEMWEYCKLEEVFVERNQKEVADANYPLCSFIAHKGVVPKDKYDRSFLVKSDGKKYKRTEINDFIYSSNNLETGSIGLNKFGRATISPVYSIFMVKGDSDFIAGLASTPRFIYEMIRFRQGVVYGQWRIHESDFLKIKGSV